MSRHVILRGLRVSALLAGRPQKQMASASGSVRSNSVRTKREISAQEMSVEVLPELAAIAAAVKQERDPTDLPKRTVALHVGYVGSEYRDLGVEACLHSGLDDQDMSPPDSQLSSNWLQLSRTDQLRTDLKPTVEEVLERAILEGGLMRRENYGALSKVKWTRSSRTDKGVHSLATVISLKVNCDPGHWQRDPEGIEYAESINRHLPKSMRVFSVQRVAAKFDGRIMCLSRTYKYYLPPWVLGIDLQSDHSVATGMERLRKQYIPSRNWPQRGPKRARKGGEVDPDGVMASLQSDGDAAVDDDEVVSLDAVDPVFSDSGAQPATKACTSAEAMPQSCHSEGPLQNVADTLPARGSSRAASSHGFNAGDSVLMMALSERLSNEAEAQLQATHSSSWRPFLLHLQFLRGAGEGDGRIYQAHWREVLRFEGTMAAIGPDGTPCVELTIEGGSFMFNMIRHMVGTVVAVARGILPLPFIEASLCISSRCTTPLAPPFTLMLSDNTFKKFVGHLSSEPPDYIGTTGEAYSLRSGGQRLRQEFVKEALEPAIVELIHDKSWTAWVATIDHMPPQREEVDKWLDAYQQWLTGVEKRRAQRLQQKAEGDAKTAETRQASTEHATPQCQRKCSVESVVTDISD